MSGEPQPRPLTVAAIGYSSHVAEIFVRGLLAEGVSLRLLTRDEDKLARRFPEATIVRGSLMNPDDVARAVDGVDAAVIQTPGAQRNDASTESSGAAPIIAGAKAAGVKHLIYTSVLGARGGTGVGRLDAKADVERQVRDSGIPHSILRCASYMQDIFDARLGLLKKGRFMLPVTKKRRFNYTSQADFAPFVVRELLHKQQTLNRPIDFVEPNTYSVYEIEEVLTEAAGRQVKGVGKFPTYYALSAAKPYFLLRGHSLAWVMPLVRYWDRNGNLAMGESVSSVAPTFHMTTLPAHLATLFDPSHEAHDHIRR